jgi:hypothetical protein
MSSSEFTEAAVWGGRPIARKISDAVPRGRLVVSGVIERACLATAHGTTTYECTLDDGTGQITLIFLGRRGVAGVVAGARCTIEGTGMMEGGRLVVWNPLYRIEADGH